MSFSGAQQGTSTTVPYVARVAAALNVSVSDGGDGTPSATPGRAKIIPLGKGKPFSLAALRERLAMIQEQADAMRADDTNADMSRIDGWLANVGGQFDALTAELTNQDKDEGFSITIEAVQADYENKETTQAATARRALATRFRQVVVTLSNLQKTLNDAFDAQQAEAAQRAAEAEQREAEALAQAEMEAYVEEQRQLSARSKKGTASSNATNDDDDGEAVGTEGDGRAQFPHNGKHRPPSGAVGKPKILREQTAEKNAVALYQTANAAEVIAWETEAINNGLETDSVTIIYRFNHTIGADQGSMTNCIRMEGHHHGHPIIESGSKTSFESYLSRYVATNVALAKTNEGKAIEGLNAAIAFLKRVGLPAPGYLKAVPKPLMAKLTL